MKHVVAAVMSLVLLLAPIGQVLATCCAVSATAEQGRVMHHEMAGDEMPCHGHTSAASTDTEEDHRHAHDCANTIDCCGAAASALADPPGQPQLTPARTDVAAMLDATPRHLPRPFFRPPSST